MAQSSKIKNLEKDFPNIEGINKVYNALNLSEWYAQEDFPKQAEEYAEIAYGLAQTLGRKEEMAKARLFEGRALLGKNKWKGINENRAKKFFEEGLELSNNKNLKLTLLEELKQIAFKNGRNEDLREIMLKVAVLNGDIPADDQQEDMFKKPRKNNKTEEEPKSTSPRSNVNLNKRRDAYIQKQNDDLENAINNLQQQQQMLSQSLIKKEAAISKMSADQIKAELLLNRQQQIVDSLIYNSMLDSFTLASKEMKLKEQETRLDLQNTTLSLQKTQRNLFIALAICGLLIAVGLFLRNRGIQRYTKQLEEKNITIQEERLRSEKLLLNILPASVAEELKLNGIAQARHYKNVTVMFTDFIDFSRISSAMSPQDLLDSLDYCFKEFDRIIEKYQLEKIKTIGDAYMCAGGLPEVDKDHAVRTVKAALEIQAFLIRIEKERATPDAPFFKARIGIHTGPTVAGVVGLTKFAYDIWGDTVNIAARLETSGEEDQVNISATTYELVKTEFKCTYRGKIPAKNIGEIDMYFVESIV